MDAIVSSVPAMHGEPLLLKSPIPDQQTSVWNAASPRIGGYLGRATPAITRKGGNISNRSRTVSTSPGEYIRHTKCAGYTASDMECPIFVVYDAQPVTSVNATVGPTIPSQGILNISVKSASVTGKLHRHHQSLKFSG